MKANPPQDIEVKHNAATTMPIAIRQRDRHERLGRPLPQ